MKYALKLGTAALAATLLLAGCATTDTAAPAATAAAPAVSDAELAAKLKGQWTGDWSIGQAGGKFVLIVSEVQGTVIKGEGHFYGTQQGDSKEAIAKGAVEKGQLVATLPSGMAIKLKMKNEKALAGSWSISGFTGDLKATRN